MSSPPVDNYNCYYIYQRQKGTTANSYLIQATHTALIDPPGESFTQIFLEQLQVHQDLTQLNYIILNHVNPNRMATLKELLQQAPQAQIICSKPAAIALKAAFPHWEDKITIIRSEDFLDLGEGHKLQFVTVPTPRWADGMCTYDPATRILYTDKFFGVHVCSDLVFDENWKQLDRSWRRLVNICNYRSGESIRIYWGDCNSASQIR